MKKWISKGLSTGIVTTTYPDKKEASPGVSPGMPLGGKGKVPDCPTGVISADHESLKISREKCIQCFYCLRGNQNIYWDKSYEWAIPSKHKAWGNSQKAFSRSLNIRVLDAGCCGACLSEIEQLNKPYYNMHRLGFFLTATPRDADILLVAGPVTDHMRVALRKAYEAMPAPKGVIAAGICALSGGIFGPSFACGEGVPGIIPVDVLIPGCPPPPLALLHGILTIANRTEQKTAASGGGTDNA